MKFSQSALRVLGLAPATVSSPESCPDNIGRQRQWPKRLAGIAILLVGWMLSPLSWWNDIFINMPIAIAFGYIVALFVPPWFKAGVIVGYALTNVLGFVLMSAGSSVARVAALPPRRFRRDVC